MSAWNNPEIQALIELALSEDIGPGDVTAERCIPADQISSGRFLAQGDAVLCGVELLPLIFQRRGGVQESELLRKSGDTVAPGDSVARVRGTTRTLLECERTALNFIQRLSGVATLARRYADAVAGTGTRILDTRKTTPGWRRLEKLATAAGGVTNHRMALYDAVLIKNNHIAAAGGIREALERFAGCGLPVEIEVRTQAELEDALAAGATHLLLDNQTPKQAAALVRHVAGRAVIELSGNITLDTIRAYAQAGADFISSGAITHQAQSLPFNFRLAQRMNFEIHRFDSLESTMHLAAEWAAAGYPEGTVVMADEQTQGQGRHGRAWHSERGTGLYFTLVLRPKLCPESLPVVTLALGLAVAESIEAHTGLMTDLRWPNDVLLGERKCAGILAQLADGALLAGIGINVNQQSFPPEIAPVATSLRIASGREYDREPLLERVLEASVSHVDLLLKNGKGPVLDAFSRASSYVRGKRVVVDQPGEPLRGVTEGLDAQGFLMLRTDAGTRTRILAEE